MQRLAPLFIAALALAILPIAVPTLPERIIEYVRPPAARQEATVLAVGDIMLSRWVGKRMLEHGYAYPFAGTAQLIGSADIAFGNLETSITPGEPVESGEMSFRADPETARALRDAGFDILSLANNHTPNFGESGLLDTFRYLDEAGVRRVGAGRDDAEAGMPVFISANGIRFAFLAYNDPRIVPAAYEAAAGRAGTAFMDIPAMTAAVEEAKKAADIVIVSMHAGDEYEELPNDSQRAFAHAAIDAGAEMVIGHHPHVVQTEEIYKGKHIFYSLGNFIFDQMFSMETREGLAVEATFDTRGLIALSYHPVRIEDYAQPRLLTGDAAKAVLRRLGVDRGL